jgi:hypothetical protein
MEPQMNADERRFINLVLNTLHSSRYNLEPNPTSIELSGLNYLIGNKT